MLTFLVCVCNLNAQTSNSANLQVLTPEAEIVNVFGSDWVNRNRAMVDVLINCRMTRISLVQKELETDEKFPVLSSYPLLNRFNPGVEAVDASTFNVNTFNPFTYHLDFMSDKTQVIRIDGTGYLLIIDPIKR